VCDSAVAFGYYNRAAKFDGHGGYYALYNGYQFNGAAAAAILMSELTSIRLKPTELPAAFCLRLTTLFEDLEDLPGADAFIFNEQQKIQYLLTAVRNERTLASSYNYIQTEVTRGRITFAEAVDDITVRCEATRADEILASPAVDGKRRGLVSQMPSHRSGETADSLLSDQSESSAIITLLTSMNNRLNNGGGRGGGSHAREKGSGDRKLTPCLANACVEDCPFPLCRLHFAELQCGRTKELTLRDNYGVATYSVAEKMVQYPSTVPQSAQALPSRANRRQGKGRGRQQ
jgi:hypothetical protein